MRGRRQHYALWGPLGFLTFLYETVQNSLLKNKFVLPVTNSTFTVSASISWCTSTVVSISCKVRNTVAIVVTRVALAWLLLKRIQKNSIKLK